MGQIKQELIQLGELEPIQEDAYLEQRQEEILKRFKERWSFQLEDRAEEGKDWF